jgi:hypothetical protein
MTYARFEEIPARAPGNASAGPPAAEKIAVTVTGSVTMACYSGCQNNVSLAGRYFVTTTYAALFFSGTFL